MTVMTEALKRVIVITSSGYTFDVTVKDRQTGKVLETYMDIDPAFVGTFINELLADVKH